VAEYREFQDDELIAGTRYRVLRLIGVGGMGTVYEVEHTELGKRFVLKALLRELSRREDLVIRLRNEWRALGRLEHPNIVTVTDAGTSAGGVPYYVMERLEGETLAQRMRKTRRFAVRDAVEIAIGVLEGLAAAHQIGVVHRDVKPPNIFLLSDGRPKVLDFGVAKIADDPGVVTARGVAVGTPRYMSPEQARGEAVDGRADVYSTGLILFETIAGVSPFDDARDANELILAHLAKVPPPLSSLAMGVPPVLDAMVASMLAKGRAERPDTALEAARRLRELIPGLGELRASLPPAVEAVAARSKPAARVHDTTRPDGVATRGPATATSQTAAEGLSWLERPTLPRSLLNSEAGAGVSGPWSRVSADTLVGLPPTSNPDAATPLESSGRVSTEVLTAVPLPDAAVTRTRFPAARTSETPPPVTPVEPLATPAVRAATSRRSLWLGSAAAGLAAIIALVAARFGSSEGGARTAPVRGAVHPVPAVAANGAAVTPAPAVAPPTSAERAHSEVPAPAVAQTHLASSEGGTRSAVPVEKPRPTAARREGRQKPGAGPAADSARPAVASAAPTKKKPPESALPGSGL
jgi:serine/threonine-protein kinase